MMDLRLGWLTVALVGWFIVQATGWSIGWHYATLAHGGLGAPQPNRPLNAATTPTLTGWAGNQPHPGSDHHGTAAAHTKPSSAPRWP
jgi:hypothetical protein